MSVRQNTLKCSECDSAYCPGAWLGWTFCETLCPYCCEKLGYNKTLNRKQCPNCLRYPPE